MKKPSQYRTLRNVEQQYFARSKMKLLFAKKWSAADSTNPEFAMKWRKQLVDTRKSEGFVKRRNYDGKRRKWKRHADMNQSARSAKKWRGQIADMRKNVDFAKRRSYDGAKKNWKKRKSDI